MTKTAGTLKHVKLELARSKDFPNGSTRHGYDIVAPLDAKNHLDVAAWKANRAKCRVRRFWEGEDDEIGLLTHKPGGAEHAHWVFDYDPSQQNDDESGYLLGSHVLAPGEYVTIGGEKHKIHTFVVASVEPL